MDDTTIQINIEYKVLVSCMTYNQSQYIEDALNGFVMQQTDFPFVCLVMDDASTDGEQDVIKAFLAKECDMSGAEHYEIDEAYIIISQPMRNRNCTLAVYFLKYNLYGTGKKEPLVKSWRDHCNYVAMCEGDDYWTDEYKLQKQISFLECHNDFVMCTTRLKVFNEKEQTYKSDLFPKDVTDQGKVYDIEDCLAGDYYFHLLTSVYRADAKGYSLFQKCKSGLDRALVFYLLSDGDKCMCLPDVTACYRRNENSVWAYKHNIEKFEIVVRAAMAVYENTPNFDAARFLYMNLSTGVSRKWLLKNKKDFLFMLSVIRKHLGIKPCIGLIWNNILLGK